MKIHAKCRKNKLFVIIMTFALMLSQMAGIMVPAGKASAANYIRIKNVWQQGYLYDDGDQVKYGNLGTDDQRTQWELVDAGSNMVRIKNRASGKYMNIEHQYGYVECTGINNDWSSAKWYVEDAGNGQKRIKSGWLSNYFVHVENQQGRAQYGSIYGSWDSAKWIFETAVEVTPTQTPDPTQPPVQPDTQSPYDGTPASISFGSRIEAERYDLGGEGIAYHDSDAGNSGNVFRTDDVDIEACSDAGGGYDVGWLVSGEWLEYTVNASAGTYNISARVSSGSTGNVGDLRILLDGTELGTFPVEVTGGWQTFTTLTLNNIVIPGGNNKILRLEIVNGGDFNINYVQFTEASGTEPTPVPTEIPTPTPDPTQPPAGPGSNLALGKEVTASSSVFTFIAANANDGDTATYWEGAGGSYPNTLTLKLGANADITSIVLKLNPNSAWSARTQNIQVLGHAQDSTQFVNLVSANNYTFNPSSGNTVTIPVTATVSDIQLKINSNTGSSAGQVAEFEVIGTAAPNPDLTVTGLSFAPQSPVETDEITVSAIVKNIGTAASEATELNFYLDSKTAGTVSVPAIAMGGQTTVALNLGAKDAGTYALSAKVNEANTIVELNTSNNSFTGSNALTVSQVPSSDLIGSVSWAPGNPSAGNDVTFTVNLKNQGNVATAGGSHNITLALKDAAGSVIKNYTNSYNGVLAPGASVNVVMGTWTAVNGSYNVTCTVAADANEVEIKEANNESTTSLYSGRGANMPFTVLEAEASSNSTNGTKLAPNFIPGDFAGEASGRSSVYLDTAGEYVEFTLTSPANAFVLRSAVAENTNGTVSVYVDGADKGNFNVTSKFSYVYATPSTLGRLGYDNTGEKAYWLYEDAQLMLDQVYPAGTKIRIQKDAGDVSWIYVDMLETENVAPAASNPDPAKYVEVSASKSIEQALTEFRQDPAKKGIFIPAGEWEITNKIFLYGRAVEIIGAGPWHTKLVAPKSSSNNDVGFNISSTANGSTIKNLSAWGNYIYRQDGPGKFLDGNGMQNVTIENVWAEHFICLYWGVNSSNNTFKDCRIKNMFADGINMTNGSSNNVITNCYARGCGDDSFALFSATDAGGSYNVGNVYSNLTAVCTRRAASFAVYGGSGNLYQNLYGADTLTYPGITISSLSFGYNTLGFGNVDCVFDGVTLDRCGGDFWTSVGADDKINDYQNFGAIWIYCGDRAFKNVLVKNVDINNPVYYGLQFQTMYPNKLSMENVRFENVNINNPTRYGIKFCVMAEAGQGPCLGEASFTNVKINNAGVMPVYGQSQCPGFTVNKIGTGNNW